MNVASGRPADAGLARSDSTAGACVCCLAGRGPAQARCSLHRQLLIALCAAPPAPLPATGLKVRKGAVGLNKQELSADVRAALLAKWREVMLPATGKASGRVSLQRPAATA